MCCSRLALMRLEPFSYFWSCWNVRPRASANLGHADTRMVEKHYGHLAPSFISDAIKAGAPRYRVRDEKQVVPLR